MKRNEKKCLYWGLCEREYPNHRTYTDSPKKCAPITGLITVSVSTWGLSKYACWSQGLSQDFLPQPEDLRTWTPTWGHYWGWLVTWPGCCKSHADFVIPQHFQRASWAHNLLEIGPKGWANGCDGRLLRLTFNTNSCKYNVLSLGFQQQIDQESIGGPMTHTLDLMQGVPVSASAVAPPDHSECLAISFSLEGNTVWIQLMNHDCVGTWPLLHSQSWGRCG